MRKLLLAALLVAFGIAANAALASEHHSVRYRAVVWHQKEIREARKEITAERARALRFVSKPWEPLSWDLPLLRVGLRWHREVLVAAHGWPDPPMPAVARDEAVRVLGYPAGEWNCLARIVPYEGGWRFVFNTAGSGAYGPWQALPASKILPYKRAGDPDSVALADIRTHVRWAVAYARRYGGGCGSLRFRLGHNYW